MDIIWILWSYQPRWGLWTAVAAAISAALLFVISLRIRSWKWRHRVAFMAMGCYLIIVYMSTVFTRIPTPERRYMLEVFWSYRRIAAGGRELLKEDLLNCFLLLPMGALLPVLLRRPDGQKLGIVVLGGLICSASVEVLQLVLKRGFFEWDDIIHNVLSVVLGFLVWKILSGITGHMRRCP